MQLLFESSEEGDVACLGLLPGRVRRFADRDDLPVPHMGWNQLEFSAASPLLDDIASGDHVYFVHSYCCAGERDHARDDDVRRALRRHRPAAATSSARSFIRSAPRAAGALLLRNFLHLHDETRHHGTDSRHRSARTAAACAC